MTRYGCEKAGEKAGENAARAGKALLPTDPTPLGRVGLRQAAHAPAPARPRRPGSPAGGTARAAARPLPCPPSPRPRGNPRWRCWWPAGGVVEGQLCWGHWERVCLPTKATPTKVVAKRALHHRATTTESSGAAKDRSLGHLADAPGRNTGAEASRPGHALPSNDAKQTAMLVPGEQARARACSSPHLFPRPADPRAH